MAVFFIKCVLILHLVIIFDIFTWVASSEEGTKLRSVHIYTCPPRAYLYMTKNKTTACRACTVCSPGYGVAVPCSQATDTVCEPCPEGTYNPWRTLNERCRQCRKCSYPNVRVRKCQPDRDASCNWCEKGYYFDSVVGICVKCAYCFPEIPNLTTRIPACEVPGVNKDEQCVPISHTKYWRAEAERRRKVINNTKKSNAPSTLAAILDTQTQQIHEIQTSEEEPTLETIVVITVMTMMLIAVISLIAFCILRDRHMGVCGGKRRTRRNYTTGAPVSTGTYDDVESTKLCLEKQPPFVADKQVGSTSICVVELPEKVPL